MNPAVQRIVRPAVQVAAAPGRRVVFPRPTALAALLATGPALAGWWADSPVLLWLGFPAALWLAFVSAESLVTILTVTTPTFPVIRLADDMVGAKRVSTKGMFFAADDPLIAALFVAWLWKRMSRREAASPGYPSALAGLILLYPAVLLINAARLDWAQMTVSGLYYFKWLQYAFLCIAVPQLLEGASPGMVVKSVRRAAWIALAASGGFAVYESLMAIRTGSYTIAASIPRASAFFGSLDPTRYGASEDPVNFGIWAMVAGSIALAGAGQSGRRLSASAATGLLAAITALLLSASRAPWLAAAGAFIRIQRIRSARLVVAGVVCLSFGVTTWAALPDLWDTTIGRFKLLGEGRDSSEGSAIDRMVIAMNSPVFQFDQFWLTGHGHSSYRFIAEAHLASITGGVSRSLYNFLLTVWYDAGVAGIVLWILLFLQLSGRFKSIARHNPDSRVRSLATGLRGALDGLAIASMFGEAPYNWRVMGFFYLLTGVCLAGERALSRPPAPPGAWIVGWGRSCRR